jgi:hypothetical protein
VASAPIRSATDRLNKIFFISAVPSRNDQAIQSSINQELGTLVGCPGQENGSLVEPKLLANTLG